MKDEPRTLAFEACSSASDIFTCAYWHCAPREQLPELKYQQGCFFTSTGAATRSLSDTGEETLAFVGVTGVDKASEGAALDLVVRSVRGPPPFPLLLPLLERSTDDCHDCALDDDRWLSRLAE